MIREATIKDWKSIQELNRAIFIYEDLIQPSAKSNLQFPDSSDAINYFKAACLQQDNHIAFVFEEDAQIVGYLIVKLIPSSELTHRVGIRSAQMHTISVKETHRNLGIGRKLLNAGIDWAKNNKVNRVKVVSYASNSHAKHTYESLGFKEFETVYELEV